MKTRYLIALTSLLLLFGPYASGDVIVSLVDRYGNDSGWDAVLTDNVHTGIIVDAVTGDAVTIQIAKDFYLPPEQGFFPPNSIYFTQRLDDATTVPVIKIADEAIVNNTGMAWTDYHWQIVGCTAVFDPEATEQSGFDVDPFTNMIWGPNGKSLDVDGGVVPNGWTFFPGDDGGSLYIRVDLAGDDSDFYLTQYPTPEPGTIALLISGGFAVLVRRRRVS